MQLVCALRLVFPDVGHRFVHARICRNCATASIPLGITMISAGSHTEPGGYTGAGRENTHQTERGRIIDAGPANGPGRRERPMPRASSKSPTTVPRAKCEAMLRRLGYEPVWKDWDAALTA